MGYIVILVVIWAVIAYFYKEAKNISFKTAFIRVPLIILHFIFELAGNSTSTEDDLKRKAKRAGRDDIVDKMNEQQERRKEMKSTIDSKLDETNPNKKQ